MNTTKQKERCIPMKRTQAITLALATALFVAGISAVWWTQRQQSVGEFHAGNKVVPVSEFTNPAAAEEFYREAIAREPERLENYIELAQLFMQFARTSSNELKYIPRARRLIEEARSRDPQDYRARVLQATLLNTLHRFEDARDLARALIAENPDHAYNYGTLVDALVELGEYDEAVGVCDRMLSIRPDISSYSRASYLRELHGDIEGAMAAMRLAADAGATGSESRAWALYQLGHLYLSEAKLDTAAFIFDGILEERPDYARATVGLGHVLIAKGELDRAADLVGAAAPLTPDAPLDVITEIHRTAGNEHEYNRALEAGVRSFEAFAEMGEIVNMEYADFLAEHDIDVASALRLAEIEYARRPDHYHVQETYAWALHKNGRSVEARAIIEAARAANPGDALLNYRAGMVLLGTGDVAGARDRLSSALEKHVEIESQFAAREARAVITDIDENPRRAIQSRL